MEDTNTTVPSFDLFADRTQSLLERWQRFLAAEAHKCESPEELQALQDKCLIGVVLEIADDFTQTMVEEAKQRQSK